MQVEDISQRIWNLPSLRQPRLNIEVLVTRQQRIEEKFANALRLRVDPNARIKIRRAAFDNHHQRIERQRLGAGKKRQISADK